MEGKLYREEMLKLKKREVELIEQLVEQLTIIADRTEPNVSVTYGETQRREMEKGDGDVYCQGEKI